MIYFSNLKFEYDGPRIDFRLANSHSLVQLIAINYCLSHSRPSTLKAVWSLQLFGSHDLHQPWSMNHGTLLAMKSVCCQLCSSSSSPSSTPRKKKQNKNKKETNFSIWCSRQLAMRIQWFRQTLSSQFLLWIVCIFIDDDHELLCSGSSKWWNLTKPNLMTE